MNDTAGPCLCERSVEVLAARQLIVAASEVRFLHLNRSTHDPDFPWRRDLGQLHPGHFPSSRLECRWVWLDAGGRGCVLWSSRPPTLLCNLLARCSKGRWPDVSSVFCLRDLGQRLLSQLRSRAGGGTTSLRTLWTLVPSVSVLRGQRPLCQGLFFQVVLGVRSSCAVQRRFLRGCSRIRWGCRGTPGGCGGTRPSRFHIAQAGV